MTNFFVYGVSSGIINYLLFKELLINYELKKSKIETFILITLFTIMVTSVNLLKIPLLNLLTTLISYIFLKILLFNIPVLDEFGKDLINFFILVFLDSLSFFLSGLLYADNIAYFRTLTSSIIVLLLNTFLFSIFRYSRIEKIPKFEAILFLFISLFNVLLIYIFSLNYFQMNKKYKILVLFIILGLVCITAIIFHYLEYINKNHELQNKIKLGKLEMKMMVQHYHDTKIQYQETRKLIHDFKNHMYALSLAYENNKIDLARSILQQFSEQCDNKKIKFITGSDILDIILNDKLLRCKELSIKFSFKTDGINLSWIKEFDIITIIGNLLDNAIEANTNEKISNKYIEMKLYQKNDMAVIKIKNSCNNHLKKINQVVYSTKKGHSGYGIENVKRTVEKYDGTFDIEIKESTCIVVIYLLMTTV